ncbi:NUMOD4 domain-containing protein [Kaistella solincola]|uniref:NUMOD4 domain-containing protein n=1 Tax=Kaistella solincola TaxID=510955 RepID=UPI000691B410|nr:HNH endonuclease [Kaistella solincola]
MLYPTEIWKEYPLNLENDSQYRVEVSNFGRVKTYNKNRPDGGLIKGSLQGGYPIVRFTLFKERPLDVAEKIEALNELIAFLEDRRRTLVKKSLKTPEEIAEIEELKNQRLSVIAKRKKYILKTDRKRQVFSHFLIHRAVAELFLEKPADAEVVIHKDFNKENNHASNLQWATKEEAFARYADNPYYKTKKYAEKTFGAERKKSANEKLSVENVLYIKEKLAQGKTLRELAQQFKVSDMQIHRIKTGENWKNVKTLSEIKTQKEKK